MDLKASFAAGIIQDGKVFLAPIDEAVALRPQLRHLNRAAEGQPGIKAEADGKEPPAHQPLAVRHSLFSHAHNPSSIIDWFIHIRNLIGCTSACADHAAAMNVTQARS